MELRQLEYFVSVVEEGGFTKAAVKLHVAQPGVSAQVKQLERELGQPLFDRSGRSVTLTEVGRAVLPYARAALWAVTGMRDVVDEFTGLLRGRVVMAVVTAPWALDLAGLLAGFHAKHPAVEITLNEMDPITLAEALAAGQVDLALLGLGAPLPAGVETQVVIDQDVVAAVRRGHSLDERDSVTVSELRDLTLITLPPGTGLRSVLEAACAGAGFRPRVAFEASEPYFLAKLAAHGLGVAILPRSAVSRYDDLHVLEIREPAMRGQMGLAWRTDQPAGPAARALVEHARAAMG
ncbi:LysR family transcriptional regulator [Nonomuraea endophytica]|uniref:DNA-binding transcriptional LysR family regulator n=1 Tax=Nonomuraea endophytica TaxID=714136 RepID=A0A7W7ZX19_9ACTN|nr:LysR family transcriptional regulator [Nonomuraea endophytica]MBB5075382.1 DNA-binding transcriptional LysR family regulator [Nonomuraea endophytica]